MRRIEHPGPGATLSAGLNAGRHSRLHGGFRMSIESLASIGLVVSDRGHTCAAEDFAPKERKAREANPKPLHGKKFR